jgi:hypothetical protein
VEDAAGEDEARADSGVLLDEMINMETIPCLRCRNGMAAKEILTSVPPLSVPEMERIGLCEAHVGEF